MDIIKILQEELGIRRGQVETTIKLIDEGNTIPYIARYRKEMTGSLDDETLRNFHERLLYLRNLEDRKEAIKKNIEEQERQNERLEKFIQKAKHYQDLNSLTPDALRDMVSAIYVGAPDKSSGKRQQKIEIYYDGAGFIPLNLLMQRETA